MFNRIKEFLSTYPDSAAGKPLTSAYRFWKDTQLSRSTAYRLYNDSSYIPTGDVLEKICSSYRIKPGVILDWEPDSKHQDMATEAEPQNISDDQDKKSSSGSQAQKRGHTAFFHVVPNVPKSA